EAERYEPATQEAQEAIRLEPDLDLGHFVLARALAGRNRLREAGAAGRGAVRLGPEGAGDRALLAGGGLEQTRWGGPPEAAARGGWRWTRSTSAAPTCGRWRWSSWAATPRRARRWPTPWPTTPRTPSATPTRAGRCCTRASRGRRWSTSARRCAWSRGWSSPG